MARPRPIRRGSIASPSAAQVRDTLRELARWAVATTALAAGGCTSIHGTDDLSQHVPTAGGGAGYGDLPMAGRGVMSTAGSGAPDRPKVPDPDEDRVTPPPMTTAPMTTAPMTTPPMTTPPP